MERSLVFYLDGLGLPTQGIFGTEFEYGAVAFMEQARQVGALIVKPAQPTFWGGYAGYFQDPDQQAWEVL